MAMSTGDYRDQDGAPKSVPASPSVGPHSAAQTATDPLTDAAKPEVKIDTQSCRALKTDCTLRFLYDGGFTLDSRLSGPTIALADNLVETFCSALLQRISRKAASGEAASGETASGETASGETASGEAASGGAASGEAASGGAASGEAASGGAASGEAASFDKRHLMVHLLEHRILICFDLFLEGCDAQLRKEVEQSHERPIYKISQKDNVYRVRRWKAADRRVAVKYTMVQESEYKGKPPYFTDGENPPVYVRGVRLEPWEVEAIQAQDSDDPEDPENTEKCNEADSVDECE